MANLRPRLRNINYEAYMNSDSDDYDVDMTFTPDLRDVRGFSSPHDEDEVSDSDDDTEQSEESGVSSPHDEDEVSDSDDTEQSDEYEEESEDETEYSDEEIEYIENSAHQRQSDNEDDLDWSESNYLIEFSTQQSCNNTVQENMIQQTCAQRTSSGKKRKIICETNVKQQVGSKRDGSDTQGSDPAPTETDEQEGENQVAG